MSQASSPADDSFEIDLRDPRLAALLAWLWPGLGHIYQRRYAKGALFMVCILGAWFFGLALGGGRVVYANWDGSDNRWQYICQLGVGLPALPALVQHQRVAAGKDPYFVIAYRDPRTLELVSPDPGRADLLKEGLMAPPPRVRGLHQPADDVLSHWYKEAPLSFDMGVLYTMIAGLLNVLVIYDAFAGPVLSTPVRSDDKDDDGSPDDSD